jgi:hypothetical protein
MVTGPISKALQRRIDRPDIHKAVDLRILAYKGDAARPGTGETVNAISEMVRDLKDHVPELSVRQLSTLIGVGKTFVTKALDQTVPAERWSSDDNESSAAASLAALEEHHPGGFEVVTIDKDDPDERHIFLSAPDFRDTYRRADQSHTFKRPITLASRPFSVAA